MMVMVVVTVEMVLTMMVFMVMAVKAMVVWEVMTAKIGVVKVVTGNGVLCLEGDGDTGDGDCL